MTFARTLAFVLLPLTLLPAQDGHRIVPPGRQLEEHKLLSFGGCDAWDVTVVPGEVLHCTIDTGEFDPVLELVDQNGERLAVDDGRDSHSELRHMASTAGTLRFRIAGFEARGGGNYRFWLERYRTEVLAPGTPAEHEFGPEQWWHYRIPVHAGDVLVPTVQRDGRLSALFDDQQTPLPEYNGGYTAPRDGEVTLRIEGGERGRSRTLVQLAQRLDLPASGRLDGELPAFGMHHIAMHLVPGAHAFDLDFPAIDQPIAFRECSPGREPRFCWTGHMNKNGRHRQWLVVREAFDGELDLRNAHEHAARYTGRFVPLATPLAANTDVDGTLPLGGGLVYDLPAQPGDVLALDLVSTVFDAQFDVWSPRGEVWSFDDRGACDLNPRHDGFLVNVPGTWRVLVYSPGGHGSGAFRLRCDRIAVESIAVGASRTVELHGADRWVHLPLAEHQAIWLAFASRAFDAALTIVAPDGRDLGTFEGGGLDGDVLTAFRAGAAGTYTLVLRARSGQGQGELRLISP